MKKLIVASCLACSLLGGVRAELLPVPADWPSPTTNLPPLLKTFAGKEVKDRATWEKVRAPEVRKFFLENMYGRRPAEAERPPVSFANEGADKVMMDGTALRKRVRVTSKGPFGEHTFTFTAFIPTAAKGPVPAFLLICNRDPNENIDPERVQRTEFWPAEEIVARGYAALAFWNADVAPDYIVHGKSKRMIPEQNFHYGVYPAFERCNARDDASWATLSAWAWGASRVMDWIETEPKLDARKVAVVGHSRGGKTSLVAGVTDPRFAMACVNDSGCGGAKLANIDLPDSEHYSAFLRSRAIHWFCGNFEKRFVGLDGEHPSVYDRKAGLWPLKVDQHAWAALMAPRLLAVASASEDDWAGQPGEYWTCRLASPAWELYGVKGLAPGGNVHYHLRKGIHNLTLEDWNAYMDFAAAHGW